MDELNQRIDILLMNKQDSKFAYKLIDFFSGTQGPFLTVERVLQFIKSLKRCMNVANQ